MTPMICIVIAGLGMQIIETVSATYAVDCHLEMPPVYVFTSS